MQDDLVSGAEALSLETKQLASDTAADDHQAAAAMTVTPLPSTQGTGGRAAAVTRRDLVMYFVVNQDLAMGKGKIAAQVGHAAIATYLHNQSLADKDRRIKLKQWTRAGHKKIVLKASQSMIEMLSTRYPWWSVPTYDAGLTQVAPDSLTVLAFVVIEEDEVPELRKLKLL